MKPIRILVQSLSQKSPEEICANMMDMSKWPEFEGYSILPGIESAAFDVQTPNWLGSRIRVKNKDGSEHVEEVTAWDPTRRVELRFQEFKSPLRRLASHFVETWEFTARPEGTLISRSMAMHPKGVFGWLVLRLISRLMRKAFEQQATRM